MSTAIRPDVPTRSQKLRRAMRRMLSEAIACGRVAGDETRWRRHYGKMSRMRRYFDALLLHLWTEGTL